ncbi:MAG: CDP-alcohol phosphatidyltransferase family protein [Oscillospiraceae bacterium]
MIPTKNKIKHKELFTAANCITLLRIVGTVLVMFFKPLGLPFLVVYTFTGLTDVLDGWIARRTGTASEFGAKLDSVADLLFYAAMLIKLCPLLLPRLPAQLWWAAGGVLAVRICSYCTAALKFHRFASLHTYLNKLTGAAVFLLPYSILPDCAAAYCTAACAAALLASVEELIIHLSSKSYIPDRKSLFFK